LLAEGIEARDVRDAGLRGQTDVHIFEYAVSRSFTLLTGDVGFGNIVLFPLGSHAGVVIARFPNEVSTATLNDAIVHALHGLSDEDIRGNLIVIEPGRIRLRKKG